MQTKGKNMAVLSTGIAAVLLMLIFYNNIRIAGAYHWGFDGKEYAFNFVPFKDILRVLDLQNTRILQKVSFFMIIGVLQYSTISLLGQRVAGPFILFSLCTIILTEALSALSSANLVVVDINNFAFYAIGLAVGYLLCFLIKKLYGNLDFRIRVVKIQAK